MSIDHKQHCSRSLGCHVTHNPRPPALWPHVMWVNLAIPCPSRAYTIIFLHMILCAEKNAAFVVHISSHTCRGLHTSALDPRRASHRVPCDQQPIEAHGVIATGVTLLLATRTTLDTMRYQSPCLHASLPTRACTTSCNAMFD